MVCSVLYFMQQNNIVLDRSGHQTDLKYDIFSLVNLATTPLLMSPDYSWTALPVYIIIFKSALIYHGWLVQFLERWQRELQATPALLHAHQLLTQPDLQMT